MHNIIHPSVAHVVNGMTNYARTRWNGAHQPGALDKTAEVVIEYINGPSIGDRFDRERFGLVATGKVPMHQMLRGRTGIAVETVDGSTAVVTATFRMIERLQARFHYCLTVVSPDGNPCKAG